MKALDFLTRETRLAQIVCVWGSSYVLQKLVVERLYTRWSDISDHEKVVAGQMSELLGAIEEASIFGRIIEIEYRGNWRSVAGLEGVLSEVEIDRVIIRCPDEPPTLPVFSVDCSIISRKPARSKFLGIRKIVYGLGFTEEAEETLISRTVDAETIENSLEMLSYLVSGREVSVNDINDVVIPLDIRSYLMRAILTGNPVMLARELNKGEPIPFIYAVHKCFFRLYTFIEGFHAGKERETQELLRIGGYELKDWKNAVNKYPSPKLRELMEMCQRMLAHYMAGNYSGWKERFMLEAQVILRGF